MANGQKLVAAIDPPCATAPEAAGPVPPEHPMADLPAVVLDTNIVLDLWVFADPATPGLEQALLQRKIRWMATPPMREELRRVLAYPHIVGKLAHYQRSATQVLAQFDASAHLCEEAAKAVYVCKDADDQKFVDLAVAHQAFLISKDKAVLCMGKRLARLGAQVLKAWPLQA